MNKANDILYSIACDYPNDRETEDILFNYCQMKNEYAFQTIFKLCQKGDELAIRFLRKIVKEKSFFEKQAVEKIKELTKIPITEGYANYILGKLYADKSLQYYDPNLALLHFNFSKNSKKKKANSFYQLFCLNYEGRISNNGQILINKNNEEATDNYANYMKNIVKFKGKILKRLKPILVDLQLNLNQKITILETLEKLSSQGIERVH